MAAPLSPRQAGYNSPTNDKRHGQTPFQSISVFLVVAAASLIIFRAIMAAYGIKMHLASVSQASLIFYDSSGHAREAVISEPSINVTGIKRTRGSINMNVSGTSNKRLTEFLP